MRVAIINDDGEVAIQSEDIADAVAKRLNGPITRFVFRKVLKQTVNDLELETRRRTIFLGPQHK